jgi:DNA-binding response OmpR family regulator
MGKKPKLMVIEDDRDIINIIRINFELKGFDVYGCPKSSRGLAESLVELPDAIILDLLMPDKNGWEVLEELKANPVTRDIPVIICSMMKQPRAIEKAKEMGAFAYMRKPFDTSELIAMVEGAIYGDKPRR